ncbi:hypothetical protein AB4Z48_08810 [Cupriavidus sp. 2TAF22]|uniref:hypothetical protein n=1 Tax=unclassified Cupriavidus TaxID=2640874 RepID=UPI003F90343C
MPGPHARHARHTRHARHFAYPGAARNPCDLPAQAASNLDASVQCGDAFFADPAYGAAIVPQAE